jgi:hypothetical protein
VRFRGGTPLVRAVDAAWAALSRLTRSPGWAAAAPGLLSIPLAAVLVTGLAVAANRGGLAGFGVHPATASGLQGASRGAPSRVAVAPPARKQPTQQPHVAPVAALSRLYLPDALVDSPRALTLADLATVSRLPSVQGVTAVLTGPVHYGDRTGTAWGVDPSTFRGFMPKPTAASDPLWQAVSRGEAVVSYDANKAHKAPLGASVPLSGAPGASRLTRIGALAEFGVPDVDLVTSRDRAQASGLRGQALLISAPGMDAQSLQAELTRALGGPVGMHLLRTQRPQAFAAAGKTAGKNEPAQPGTLKQLYQAGASTCPGLSWTVLAAIGQIETDHGRATAVSPAGAQGPMQFMPSTWRIYGVDGNGDGVADINNQADAIYSAARYLCANGAGQGGTDLYNAVFAYNHADWYVHEVLALAAKYR